MMTTHLSRIIGGLALTCGALISCTQAPEPASAADLIITNARVFAATDSGVLEGANIAVTGDRITSISTSAIDTSGAHIIDAAGKTVMPGLIDGHVHVFFDLERGAGFPKSDSEVAAYVDGPLAEILESYLEHGFTSILSPIDFWPEITAVPLANRPVVEQLPAQPVI